MAFEALRVRPAILERDVCLSCESPVSAVSPAALLAAKQDHVDYVNQTADKDTDPHFHDMRLNKLCPEWNSR